MRSISAHVALCYTRLLIAKPFPFVVLPLALSSLLGALLWGNHDKRHLKDELRLYTPSHSRAVRELRQLVSIFPISDDDPFYATRRYDGKRTGYVVVTTSDDDNGDVLQPTALQAAMHLWETIQSLAVEGSSNETDYPSMCVKLPVPSEIAQTITTLLTANRTNYGGANGRSFCVSNPLLELFKVLRHPTLPKAGTLHLNGALSSQNLSGFAMQLLHSLPSKSQISHVWSSLFGGLSFDPETRRVASAKAILLPYALKHSTVEEDRMAEKWELALTDFLRQFHSPLINASWWTDESFASVVADDRARLEKLLLPCILSLTVFTVLASLCYSHSPLQPLLACIGIVSIAMALISATGLLSFLGLPTVSLVAAVPMIAFAMGVDNVFILMSGACVTKPAKPAMADVDQRLAHSIVSISMASLTNLVSFGIGCFSPFPAIQIFCAYSATAVLFTYLYQMTFFSASMCYLLGHVSRLWDTKHPHVSSTTSTASSIYTLSSLTYATSPPVWRPCNDDTRGTSPVKWRKQTRCQTSAAQSLSWQYSKLLRSSTARSLILFAYFIYLLSALYGCFHLEVGMEPRQLLSSTSPGAKALHMAETHFSGMTNENLHVWMWNLSRIDTRSRRLWLMMQTEIELYEHTEFTSQADSWLHAFLREQRRIDVNEVNFNDLIREFARDRRFERFKGDVVFRPDSGKLDAVRITVRLSGVGHRNQTRAMRLFRRLADGSDLPTSVYADFFNLAEQYDTLLPSTLSSVAVVGVAVGVFSFAFVPRADTAALLLLNVVSTSVGVVGCMPLLDIRLDFISMTAIVMSVGFSADYASHVAYHLSQFYFRDGADNMLVLHTVAPPIVQSATSTAIGVSFLAFTNSYIFRSFASVVLLAVGLSVIHALVLMPTLVFGMPLRIRPSRQRNYNYAWRLKNHSGERPHTNDYDYTDTVQQYRHHRRPEPHLGRIHF